LSSPDDAVSFIMKRISGHIISFILIIVLFTLGQNIYAQGTDMGLERKPGAFVGLSAGAVKSGIINESTLKVEEDASSGKMTFSGSFDVGYKFSKSFGVKTGIGYCTYDVKLSLDSYQNSLNTNDSENETYELRVNASSISETQSLKTMNVPVILIFNIPLSHVVSIFAEPGFSLVFPLNNSFTSSGLYNYQGYYAEYNVLLENLPNHGFSTNKTISSSDNLEIRHFWTDFTVSTGLSFTIKPTLHIAAGFYYSRSISNISDYEPAAEYQLSSIPGYVNSLMGGSEKVSTKALGFNVTFRYFINR
jgi:hypothetical protein